MISLPFISMVSTVYLKHPSLQFFSLKSYAFYAFKSHNNIPSPFTLFPSRTSDRDARLRYLCHLQHCSYGSSQSQPKPSPQEYKPLPKAESPVSPGMWEWTSEVYMRWMYDEQAQLWATHPLRSSRTVGCFICTVWLSTSGGWGILHACGSW